VDSIGSPTAWVFRGSRREATSLTPSQKLAFGLREGENLFAVLINPRI
jgi:hypothetical protein